MNTLHTKYTVPILAGKSIHVFATVCLAVAGFTWNTSSHAEQKFPDVIAAKVVARAAEKFDFDVTVSSPYDTPQRYADAFRVTDKAGKVLGERVLLHDHATEQPFTRDLYGVVIPKNIKLVLVQGRDQKYGWGGKTVELALPGR